MNAVCTSEYISGVCFARENSIIFVEEYRKVFCAKLGYFVAHVLSLPQSSFDESRTLVSFIISIVDIKLRKDENTRKYVSTKASP